MPYQEIERKEENSVSPTMRELAMVLFRQRKLFVAVSGLIFVLAVIYAFAGASYRAQVRVLVRRGRADPPVTAQENAPPDFSRVEVTEEELNSEVELLKDDDVLRRVVQANELAAHDWLRWLRPHEPEAVRVERAARKLAGRLNVESIKKTNLIAVSYDAPDPQLAAHVLQSLAAIYLEKHMEVHRPDGQLVKLPARTVTQLRTADNPELLRALKASLLDLELKKTQLLTKFEPNHPLVREVEEQILQAKAAITAERLTPVHDETTDQNVNYEWAKAELQ